MTREEFEAAYGQSFGQAQTRAINVDDMSEEDRAALIEHPGIHQDVRRYAELKQLAVANRLQGKVRDAGMYECKADRIFDHEIPSHLRW